MATNNNTAIRDLLNSGSPEQWKDFLFDLQISLIEKNYFESYTDKGSNEHANYFRSLKDFFTALQSK
ncbi:MAG TPA: hypothetical protein VGP43_02440 [Chitinophagaceae bacterium]|nr:hypothetical protein [Chitinophagaceae bacterium]